MKPVELFKSLYRETEDHHDYKQAENRIATCGDREDKDLCLRTIYDMVENLETCPDRHCPRCDNDIKTLYKCIKHLDPNGRIEREEETPIKMQSYADFEASLSPEVRANAKAECDAIMAPFEGQEPLLCGPEGRAAAEGPEALAAYYKEGGTHLRKVPLWDWEEQHE